MERKLEDESGEQQNFTMDNIEKQIQETYILRNLDLDSPQLNYEYLNEEKKVLDYTHVQIENYDAQKSFDQLKLVNKNVHQCNFKQKKLDEKNLISIFDTNPDFQKCDLYIAEQITIMTNIYMFLINKIRQLLPDHIISNQSDYTKNQYIDQMIRQDFPNMDYILDYLQLADSKIVKKLIKDIPEDITNYRIFFEDVFNFSDLNEILRALNLTEGRKLIIYFSNVIKYSYYIINYYKKNLHNKEGNEGNYYTKNIPKLIEVNDEFSSDEQKIFLQDTKDFKLKKNIINEEDQNEENNKRFHVFNSGELQELLDQYVQQCQQKERDHQIFLEQQKSAADVADSNLIKSENDKKNDDVISLKGFENIGEQNKYLNDENMALLNNLPINYEENFSKENKPQRLSKREKKELKKQKQKQMKALKKQQQKEQQQAKKNKQNNELLNDQQKMNEESDQIQQKQKDENIQVTNKDQMDNRILQLN